MYAHAWLPNSIEKMSEFTTKFWLDPGLALQHHTHDSCPPTRESITPSLEYRDACVCVCWGRGRGAPNIKRIYVHHKAYIPILMITNIPSCLNLQ